MNLTNMNIYLAGSGNVAWHLVYVFAKAGLPVKGIWGRNSDAVNQISKKRAIPVIPEEQFFSLPGIFLLAVSDHAIEEITMRFTHKDIILVHTAGSVSLNVLKQKAVRCGVFYPLQTFSKNRDIHFSGIPVFIEGSDSVVEKLLLHWADVLHAEKHISNSEQRLNIHIAGVFANNFINYMLSCAEIWLQENHLDRDILKPLILETVQKAMEQGAINSQTGPAVRQDCLTIEKHLQQLEHYPDLKNLYSFVTESIVRFYTKK